MKTGLTILGALMGLPVGFFGMFYAYCHGRTLGMEAGLQACYFSLFIGAPLGLITFSLIGRWLGSLLEHGGKENVAASDEEREQGSGNPPP